VLAELDAQLAPYRERARTLLGLTESGELAAVPVPMPEPAAPAPAAPAPAATTATCAGCSTVNDPDAVFCKKCGARMTNEAAS
jgi:hypothetical protein